MTLCGRGINIMDVETRAELKRIGEELQRKEERLSYIEHELHEKELFFKAVINAIPDSFAVLSADGTILFVNEHWKSFALQNSGSSVCAGAGGNYLEVCRKAAADGAVEAGQFLEAFQTLVEKQSASFALEYPCHSPVEKRWFRVRVHKTEEAEETLYLVVHENITERKRQLELQEKNNAFFETITTGARVGILIAGFDGRVIEYNRAVREMLGYNEGESFDWRSITPPEYLPQDEQVAAQIKKEGSAGLFVKEFWRKDGSRVPVGIGGKVIDAARGEVLCYMIDLSEKKELELQFSEAQRKFAAVSESMRNLLLICDADLRVTYANAAFRSEFTRDLLNSPLASSLPEDLAPLSEAAALVLKDESPRSLELEWMKNGQKRYFLADVALIDSGRGRPSVFFLLYDATDLKANELQLRRARDAAEQAMKSRTEFLSMVSHELRNPLSAVLGTTDLLENERLTPTQQDYTRLIRSQGEDLLRIIQDVLDFGRLSAGKMEAEIGPVRIRSILHEIDTIFGPRIRSKGLSWQIDIAPNVSEVISADPLRLRQILSNLLTNALKFTASGFISIRVSQTAEAGGRIFFAVTDSGIGIKADEASRLFSAFSQAGGDIERQFGGTGLGLAISQQLAALLGGCIRLQSEFTKGSTFTLELPAPAADAALLLSGAADTKADGEIAALCAHALLVEDNTVNLMVMEALLRRLGVTFESTVSGQKAVQLLEEGPSRFDIILADLELEDMSGFDFIRSVPISQPVVAVSAYPESEMAARCREAGFAAYVEKPVRLQSLGSLLGRLLVRQKSPELP